MITLFKQSLFKNAGFLILALAFGFTVSQSVFAAPKVPPTVTSPTYTNVGTTTATLGGTVTSNGGQNLLSRGVEWGTSSGSYPNSVTEGGTAVSTFTVGVSGLPSGTLIYFRAWATNPRGTGTSSESSFTTGTVAVVAPTVDSPTSRRSPITRQHLAVRYPTTVVPQLPIVEQCGVHLRIRPVISCHKAQARVRSATQEPDYHQTH